MTTQQDSVDVERLRAIVSTALYRSVLHGTAAEVNAATDEIIAALSLPITQRDEQEDQLRALSDAATYGHWRAVEHDGSIWIDADDEGDMPVALMMGGSPHNQDRADAAFILAAVAFARAAIRRLSIEQGDQDGGVTTS